tara:strand:+ start:20859 stop:22106 length:1248 start_codon:yes stop_codon:yes gene_type:complete
MQVTTSGEIHKKEVFIGNDDIACIFKKQKDDFLNLIDKSSVLYNKDVVINDTALNYLNIIPENSLEECLKNIILKEYYNCEKMYPYLGDYMLHKLFQIKHTKISGGSFIFSKKDENKFISSLNSNVIENIANWFFSNTNLNRSINIEKYRGDTFLVECLSDFIFNIDYDFSFFSKIKGQDIKNYRFIIINGIIESIGEIHHLLYKANNTKEPYVLFCFGMSEEVKQTILKNNNMGRFRVLPVCLNVNDESSLNILNDIAAIHDSSVVTSDLGQTISQEVSKDLDFGKKISFFKNHIAINPVASKAKIESHRKFLKKRIEEAETRPDVRIDVLQNRLKMFTGNRINFYVPEQLLSDTNYSRRIDYFFRFIACLKLKMRIVNLNDQKFYIPDHFINIVESKRKSLISKFTNIHAAIV